DAELDRDNLPGGNAPRSRVALARDSVALLDAEGQDRAPVRPGTLGTFRRQLDPALPRFPVAFTRFPGGVATVEVDRARNAAAVTMQLDEPHDALPPRVVVDAQRHRVAGR